MNPSDLGRNLVINHNISTRETLIQSPTNILTPVKGYLRINSEKTFDMIPAVNGFNNLIVQDSSDLIMAANSHLIVGSNNSITLKSKGAIKLASHSEIRFQKGSTFCNEGGKISSFDEINFLGSARMIFESGSHYINCAVAESFNANGIKLVLLDSAVLEIPDSTTLHFTGNETALIMKPNSKLKMGVGSKIIFDSSASLIANGATFTSIDPALNWEGFILTNSGVDSVINCTFTNAKTSLTITNSSTSFYTNRVIKNNIFNIPPGGVYKGIYGENNYSILIQDNTFNMPVYTTSESPVPLIYVGLYLKNYAVRPPGSRENDHIRTA